MMNKVLSLIVLATFLLNDTCFGLGVQPGTTQSATRDEMYALGQKLFAAKNGPGTIDWDTSIPREFTGQRPEIDGVQIVETDYNNPPEGWKKNPLLKETDLIAALKNFALTQAGLNDSDFDIREGYFPIDKSKGEIPIARIENEGKRHVLIVHTEFVQAWNHIRQNDVWFKYKFSDGKARVVSAAWAIFYRLSKHEMSDLEKINGLPKNIGHITQYHDVLVPHLMPNEIITNAIRGRYNIVNDSIWLWFLSSYSFTNNVRYDNTELEKRIVWLFEGDEPDTRKMTREEFPNLTNSTQNSIIDRNLAISIALFANYHFFSRPGIAIPQFAIDIKFIAECERRGDARKAAGITDHPIYAASGLGEEKVEPILVMLKEKADNRNSLTEDRLHTVVALLDYGAVQDELISSEYISFLKFVAENTNFKLEYRVIASAALLRHGIDKVKNYEFLNMVSKNKNIHDRKLSSRIRTCGELLTRGFDIEQNRGFLNSIASNPNVPIKERMLACTFLSAAGRRMNDYYPFIKQIMYGNFADEPAKLFARITLLNAGIETQESLAYLHRTVENRNQRAELRYAACDALLKYYGKLVPAEKPESPVAGIAREGVYLQDLVQHKLVNALLSMFIELKPADKARFCHEQKIGHARIIWIGEKHRRNSSFKDIFDKLVEIEGKNNGRRSPNFYDQMSVAAKIVRRADLQKKIKADRNFLRQFKQGLKEQIEHFSVYKYAGTIYAMRKYTHLAAQLKSHVDVERSMHLAAIRHTFSKWHNRFDRYAQYEKWRRHPNGKRVVYTGNKAVEGYMSYNEFAQSAHDYAELAYPVSGVINYGRRDIQVPEVPVAETRPRDVGEGSEGPGRLAADVHAKRSLPELISEYIVRIGLDKGPGSEKLSSDDLESIYKTVTLLENNQIEIFVPQHLRLTEDMQKAIKEIGKREGKTPVSCRQYSNLQGLARMLRSPSDAKRIVITNITDEQSHDGMVRFIQEYPELFRFTRLLNIATPANYQNMDNPEKTIYQAKIFTIAILARLFEIGETPMVESLLRYMVKGCLDVDDIGMDAFMSELGRPGDGTGLTREELIRRVLFLLGKTVKLVEKIGREIQLMKNFWIAA